MSTERPDLLIPDYPEDVPFIWPSFHNRHVESKDLDKRLKTSTKSRFNKISILSLLIVFCLISSAYVLHDLYYVYNNNYVFDQQEEVILISHTVELQQFRFRPVDKINIIAASLCDESNTVIDSWNLCDEYQLLGNFPNHTITTKHDITPLLFNKSTELLHNISYLISISRVDTVGNYAVNLKWCEGCHLLGYFPHYTRMIKYDVTPDLLYKARKCTDVTTHTLTSTAIYKRNSIFEENNTATRISISPGDTVNDNSSWKWCEGYHLLGHFPYKTTTIKHDVTPDLFFKATVLELIYFTRYRISISPGNTVNDSCYWCVLVYSLGYFLNNIKTLNQDDPQVLLHKATKLIDFTRYTLTPIAIFIRKSRVEHFEVCNTDTCTRISISPDINECKPNPCKHGASCTNEANGYTCVPKPGYNGKNCDIDINECKPNPCKHGASCMNEVNGYTCVCKPGYNGKSCEIDMNECKLNPCKHRASCMNEVNGYMCVCKPVCEGENCEIDINNCQSKPCQHGGKCDDQINGYRCTCIPGYTGPNCETGAFCVNRPFYLRRLYVTSCFTGAYDNMVSLGRILGAIGGFILLHTHLSDVNDVSNLREKTTVIQVNTFPFVGLILLMQCLKLGKFFTSIGKNSFTENKLTGMIHNIKKDDAALMKVEGFTTKHFGRIQQINLHIHKFVSNRSSMIPKLGMIVPKTHLDEMKTSSGMEQHGRYFSRRVLIKCQMCIDRNEALYWCNTCKRSICSFCKLYHEKVWIVKDHDVEEMRLLF